MAALTGNSISSTYTSLLKVGDNGTLSASLQAIGDGAGNSAGISLNTGGDLTATGTITANLFSGSGASITNIDAGNIATGTIDSARIPTLNQDTTGNAATATALETARTIAGVSFDGTANISLTTDNITEGSNEYYTAEKVDDQVNTLVVAGTGIQKTYNDNDGTLTITNSSPDQTVTLTGGTGISTSGTYPDFTITNDNPDQTVVLSSGTGISATGTYPNFTITNTQPDQTVALTAGTGISISGTYPTFTISRTSTDGIGLTDLSATDAGGLGSFSYNNTSGVFTYTGPSDSDVRGLISVTDSGGDGSLAYNNATGVITYTGPSESEVQAHITKTYVDSLGIAASSADILSTPRTINGVNFDGSANISFDTDSVSEGISNLYFTTARFNSSFNGKTTSDLAEGTNLYYENERVDDRVSNLIVASTGLSSVYDDTAGTLTLTNTAPDQTVALTGGTGITTSGTYPNFTITNSSPDQTVALSAGSNITVSGTYPNFTIAATDTQTDSFKTISVSGQSDVVADSSTDTLTLVGGSNVTITTAAGSDTITFAATNTQTDSFKTISVSGQSDLVADSSTDTLTLAAGSNVTITTTAGTDTVTFAATDTNTTYSAGTGLALGGTTFSLDAGLNNLTDANISSPAAGHILIYDNSNSYFENALLTAGTGIGITNADGSITIANTAVGDNAFGNIAVSGQTTIAADSTNDTLTIAAGSNITLTTNAGTDTLTIAATAGANTIAIDTFTGNGSTAAYTLSNSASSENELSVYFDGVYQLHSSYSVSGTTLTFDTNVPNGTAIEVQHLVSVNLSNVVQSLAGGDGITASASTGNVTASLSSTTPNAFTIGGNGSSGGVTINDGSIQMRTGTGSVAEIRMYCESSNAHYQTLKAAPHSAGSSAALVLPTASGNLVGTGDTGSVATAMIADDAVGYAKLGAEYTTTAAISASDVDWSTAAVFTKTLAANTTLTFSNVSTGMTVDLVISGNYTLTLPASVKEITGTYDGTVTNLIQIVSTNGSTEQWATISQEA